MIFELKGLTEEEMDAIRPWSITKTMVFANADVWLNAHQKRLTHDHPGKTVCVNARTLFHTIGKDFDDAINLHYGPWNKRWPSFVAVKLVT